MKPQQQKTEIRITGNMTSKFAKVEKKFLQSIKIPTGDDYFIQCTTWVPNTPAYSKAPKVVLTLNNFRDKIQILFPSALDLHEFAQVLFNFVDKQLHELNAAHSEAIKDYSDLHEILLMHSDKKAKETAAAEFNKQKNLDNATEDL